MNVLELLQTEVSIYTDADAGYLITGLPRKTSATDKVICSYKLTLWLLNGPELLQLGSPRWVDLIAGQFRATVDPEWTNFQSVIHDLIESYEPIEREYTVHVWTTLSFDKIVAKGAAEARDRGNEYAEKFIERAIKHLTHGTHSTPIPNEVENHKVITHCAGHAEDDSSKLSGDMEF